ncbi:MAG TPA: TolC family protein [Thermoanaerobaculia bacterium]|jgi:outer membrane protein TolC|nr:TolC family protein [Thermoanaerobaculia bacterium]
MRSSRFHLAVLLLATCGAFAVAAAAQEPPSGPGLSLLETVHSTLERDPNLAVQKARLESAQGSLAIASSQFDPVFTSGLTEVDDRTPLTPSSSQQTRTLQTTVGLAQQFRTGLSIEPQVGIVRSEDVTAGSGAANAGTVTFLVRQPLLRGRGRTATAAGELSAQRELAAAGLDVRHLTAQRLVTVVSQYWTLEATARNLDVLRASEASSRSLLENTRKLIAADQVPAAELVQLEANLAAQESARIGGERQLFAARQDLGREIGLDGAEIARLPLPADPFPAVPPEAVPPVTAGAGPYVAAALRQRADLRAARERQAETEILRRAAENALLPQLDLLFSPGYSGLVTGADPASFFSPLYRNVPGASASVALSLAWPIFNRRARGELLQIDASLRQNALAVDLIAKAIGANVPAALDAVGRDARQLEKAREAERLFERAVVNEEKKLRAGTSTLLDVINQRDRLTAARQTEVSAQLALAISLLQLRFQTGTLIGEDGAAGEVGTVQVSRLTTLPSVQEERTP